DQAFDLTTAADHGIELAGAGRRCQVDAELVDGRCSRARAAAGGRALGRALGEDLRRLGAHALEAHPERLEHTKGDALALTDEAEQKMFGADVVVVEALRFFLCEG